MTDSAGQQQTTELWCMHIIGPDEVIAYPDKESAEREAALLNAALRRHNDERLADDNCPMLYAVAEAWPWDAKSHAEDLARNIRNMECAGNA